jgi:hypothetical protein
MLKKLSENIRTIRESSARKDINRRIWAQFSFDRKDPTLKLHDNTSFIELTMKDLSDLKNYLASLDDTE